MLKNKKFQEKYLIIFLEGWQLKKNIKIATFGF